MEATGVEASMVMREAVESAHQECLLHSMLIVIRVWDSSIHFGLRLLDSFYSQAQSIQR